MAFKPDKTYGDITGGPKEFRFGGRLDVALALADTQATIDRNHAEVLALAELRERLADGVHRSELGPR